MGYLAKIGAATTKVDLFGGYSAFVKILSKADEDACDAARLGSSKQHGRFEGDAGALARTIVETDVDNAAYATEVLVRGIASWDLDAEDGAVLPIDRKTVQLLPGLDAKKLVVAILGLGEPPSPEVPTSGANGPS